MDEARFKSLLDKYLTEKLTPDEKKQLLEWLQQPVYQDLLSAQLKEEFQNGIYEGEEDPFMLAAIKKALELKINERVASTPVVPMHTRQRYWLLRVVGFAAILATVISLVLFNQREEAGSAKAYHINHKVQKPVGPGKDGAIITLADGSQLVLDSAQNGLLSQQGTIQVVKKNGQIMYEAESDMDSTLLYNTMQTPQGRQYRLTLNDGTKVWLNAASSIRFPVAFSETERKVAITGEAYFEVAKNPNKLFIVSLPDGGEIKVLGTHFNVMAYSNESALTTTLLEGLVNVRKGSVSAVLKPGQQAQIQNDQIQEIRDADVELAIAWKNGFTSFRKADIKTIMRQVERWYNVEVTYEGTTPERKFSGDIPRDAPITDVFKIFTESDIHFKLEERKIIVTP